MSHLSRPQCVKSCYVISTQDAEAGPFTCRHFPMKTLFVVLLISQWISLTKSDIDAFVVEEINNRNRMAWQWAETLVEIMGTLADIRGTTK